VSGVPILLDGTRIRALVVGGGAVADRKASALLDAGARVRVVAVVIGEALRDREATSGGRLALAMRAYRPDDIADATLVVAATSDRAVNARVAADARAAGRLVNVVDAPGDGDWVTVATHRAGPLVVGVSAGGVPSAAARIRDSLAVRFDERYGAALEALGALRSRLLADGDAGRAAWAGAETALIGRDFCDAVERGDTVVRTAAWR
jgi:siroheme synthase-like protein